MKVQATIIVPGAVTQIDLNTGVSVPEKGVVVAGQTVGVGALFIDGHYVGQALQVEPEADEMIFADGEREWVPVRATIDCILELP